MAKELRSTTEKGISEMSIHEFIAHVKDNLQHCKGFTPQTVYVDQAQYAKLTEDKGAGQLSDAELFFNHTHLVIVTGAEHLDANAYIIS